jgi:pyrroline-5-carboxylate reductase
MSFLHETAEGETVLKVRIACIGAGTMGTALMKGASRAAGGVSICFTDTDMSKAKTAVKDLRGASCASNSEAVTGADYVFLAVKPQNLAAVLTELAPALRKQISASKMPVLVSMAAGWNTGKIQAAISGQSGAAARTPDASIPIVRIMPNTPAVVSRGVIALAVSPGIPEAKLTTLEKILGGAGMVDRIDESLMDAVTGLSGSGPAFVCQFIEALADGGVLAGLPRDKALRYAAHTVLGTAALLLETGRHPGELKDMVTSPAGTTIAGITVLERGSFRGAVISAVEAAWKRSQELGSETAAER